MTVIDFCSVKADKVFNSHSLHTNLSPARNNYHVIMKLIYSSRIHKQLASWPHANATWLPCKWLARVGRVLQMKSHRELHRDKPKGMLDLK